MCRLAEYTKDGVETRKVDLTEANKMWQHPWMLVHRVRLHDQLKLVATGNEGVGTPAKLHLSSRVLKADPEAGTVTLEDGRTIGADLIVGADGIYVRLTFEISIRHVLKAGSQKPENLFPEARPSFLALEKLLFVF